MIKKIQSALRKEIPTEQIEASLSKYNRFHLNGFRGSSLHFFLGELQSIYPCTLFVTTDYEKAASAVSDLQEISVNQVYLFPPTRQKPYDQQQVADTSLLVQRSEVLEQISKGDVKILVAPAEALFEKLIPSSTFNEASFEINKGLEISPEQLSNELTSQNYQPVRFVDSPGEFAIRGGIFDIFPFSGGYPVRLEFFGDEIESIREFDPDSQRSIAFLNKTRIVPNASYSTNGNKESLISYLQPEIPVVVEQPDIVKSIISDLYQKADEAYTELNNADIPKPVSQYVSEKLWVKELKNRPLITSGSFSDNKDCDEFSLLSLAHPEFGGSFKLLRDFIEDKSRGGFQTVILCDNQIQSDRFLDLLGGSSSDFNYVLNVKSLHGGFILPNQKLCVLTDHQIFNRYHRPKIRRKKVKGGISFKELKELNVGDYVVHVDYGIGRFEGFKQIDVRNSKQEAAVLRYKNDSILYVNVTSLHKLQKYSGKEGKQPRITKLGSGEWARKKAQTKKKVKDIARDLINLYARRKALNAYSFSTDNDWQKEMEARFEFEETPDQMDAIIAVKHDMESKQPMDRLICGDVGFGKTEVAIRAAFKAVMDQKQVAVLVPTTILADQHFKTFQKRMESFPIRIEALSRFRSPGEQKKIIKELEQGKVDILIGTHRIVSKDVNFKDLGLMIIDEEQRFGVTAKEKLKEFRASVDVLTLTATPIPRTLQFSLMGARDLSIINTPPVNRQPVYTEIHSFDETLISDAIIQETSRGGQVFFINNRVKNIEEVAAMVRELVPTVRVRTAHGQMKASQLEKIIQDFYNHKFDVLISTNIVENGIDISNANTIIINNANNFGLSELHQLRGRVGRSNRKAFCYLITPPVRTLSADARKRLTALEEFSDLGAGFNIAMRDLDIRGAGDILGAEQSGFITDIGFEMYTKILDDAVRELKETEFSSMFSNEPRPLERPDTLVEFDLSAYIESEYVQDNVERLNLYRRLSESTNEEQIDDWTDELKDRFGPLPDAVKHLVLASKIKLFASSLFLKKIVIRANRMWLTCPKNSSDFGLSFYSEGHFQKMLSEIESDEAHPFKVVQKNDKITLVISNISSAREACNYLKSITKPAESLQESV